MNENERNHFGKLLGMLGSDQVGERAAAALKADEYRKSLDLTWPQILQLQPIATASVDDLKESELIELGKTLIARYRNECPNEKPTINDWWHNLSVKTSTPPKNPLIKTIASFANVMYYIFISGLVIWLLAKYW